MTFGKGTQLSGPGMKPRFRSNKRVYKSKRQKASNKNIAKVAKKVFNANIEHKYRDTVVEVQSYFDDDPSVSTSLIDLSVVPQTNGPASDITRIGDTISPTSLECGFYCKAIPSGTSTNPATIAPAVCRVIIFRWIPIVIVGTSDPTCSAILSTFGEYTTPFSPYNHDKRDQFNILYDKVFMLDYWKPNKISKFTMKLANKSIKYIAAAPANAANKIYIMFVSDAPQPSADTAKPILADYSFRLNFTDA